MACLLTKSINLLTVSALFPQPGDVVLRWIVLSRVKEREEEVKQENAREQGDERHTGRHWINGQAFMS